MDKREEALLKLIERYNTISIDEIKEAFEINDKLDLAKMGLTGFSNQGYCSICKSVNINCRECIYQDILITVRFKKKDCWFYCWKLCFNKSYRRIEKASTPRTVLSAYRNRGKVLQEIYKEYKKKTKNN